MNFKKIIICLLILTSKNLLGSADQTSKVKRANFIYKALHELHEKKPQFNSFIKYPEIYKIIEQYLSSIDYINFANWTIIGELSFMSFADNGNLFISADWANKISIFDIMSNKSIFEGQIIANDFTRLALCGSHINKLEIFHNFLIMASRWGLNISYFYINSDKTDLGYLLNLESEFNYNYNSFDLSSDKKYLIYGDYRSVLIFDLKKLIDSCLQSKDNKNNSNQIYTLPIGYDRYKTSYSSDEDPNGKETKSMFKNIEEGEVQEYLIDNPSIVDIKISDDNKYIAIVCNNYYFKIWEINQKSVDCIYENYAKLGNSVYSGLGRDNLNNRLLSFSPNNKLLAVVRPENRIELIDLKNKEKITDFKFSDKRAKVDCHRIQISLIPNFLIVFLLDGYQIWDITTKSCIFYINNLKQRNPIDFALSSDNNILAKLVKEKDKFNLEFLNRIITPSEPFRNCAYCKKSETENNQHKSCVCEKIFYCCEICKEYDLESHKEFCLPKYLRFSKIHGLKISTNFKY